MIDDRNEYEQTKAWPIKSRMIMVVVAYLMAIETPLLPIATLMVYSLRLSHRVRNITTAMGAACRL